MTQANEAVSRPGESRGVCKGCMEVDTEAEVERLWSRMKLREGDTVSDEIYEARLDACRLCTALQGGSTCRHCGCLVRFRARLTNGLCPRPGGSAWTQL